MTMSTTKLNIGFYGHSTVSWIDSPGNVSFIDQIKLKYNANIVNVGVPQGSEERILFELKKTKAIDIAIIFHSTPRYIFLPGCTRDVSISNVPERKAKYFWSGKHSFPITREQFEQAYFNERSNIKEVFGTAEEYVEAMTYLKEYFYHPDLMTNRFHGTLLLIDNYLLNKKIKSLHLIETSMYPSWMNFQSGVVDCEINKLGTIKRDGNELVVEQNMHMADLLSKWIDTVI